MNAAETRAARNEAKRALFADAAASGLFAHPSADGSLTPEQAEFYVKLQSIDTFKSILGPDTPDAPPAKPKRPPHTRKAKPAPDPDPAPQKTGPDVRPPPDLQIQADTTVARRFAGCNSVPLKLLRRALGAGGAAWRLWSVVLPDLVTRETLETEASAIRESAPARSRKGIKAPSRARLATEERAAVEMHRNNPNTRNKRETTATVQKMLAYPAMIRHADVRGIQRYSVQAITQALKRLERFGLITTKKIWDGRTGHRRFIYHRTLFGSVPTGASGTLCSVPHSTTKKCAQESLKGGKRAGNGWSRPGPGRPKGLTRAVILAREQAKRAKNRIPSLAEERERRHQEDMKVLSECVTRFFIAEPSGRLQEPNTRQSSLDVQWTGDSPVSSATLMRQVRALREQRREVARRTTEEAYRVAYDTTMRPMIAWLSEPNAQAAVSSTVACTAEAVSATVTGTAELVDGIHQNGEFRAGAHAPARARGDLKSSLSSKLDVSIAYTRSPSAKASGDPAPLCSAGTSSEFKETPSQPNPPLSSQPPSQPPSQPAPSSTVSPETKRARERLHELLTTPTRGDPAQLRRYALGDMAGRLEATLRLPLVIPHHVASVQIPNPPQLDMRESEERRLQMLVHAFEGAWEAHSGKACWTFRYERCVAARSKYAKVLRAAAAALYEEGIAPALWCSWSLDKWLDARARENKPTKKPPPVKWLFSAARITKHSGWCRREGSGFVCGGRLMLPPVARDFALRQYALQAEAGQMCYDTTDAQLEPVIQKHLPGGYEVWKEKVRVEAARLNAELFHRIECGGWVWAHGIQIINGEWRWF